MSVRVVACALAMGLGASSARADEKQQSVDKQAAAAPAADLVATVKTSRSRAEMSAFVVKEAEQAAAKRDFTRAIPLYEALVVARGPASAEARKLADLYALASQRDDALRVLKNIVATTDDPTTLKDSQDQVDHLEKLPPDPFAKDLRLATIDKLGAQAFKLGRAAFAKKQYGDALVYYTMGYRLSPDLPGFLRELAASYDKLGAHAKMIDFYLAYLRRRPLGKNADDARKALAGEKNRLGTLSLASVLPCDEVWMMGQQVTTKLPKKDLLLPPGEYKAQCYSAKYAFSFFEYARVTAGQASQLTFNWAIIVNELKNPYGRIAIEEPRSPGVMLDVGVDQDEHGIVVPADGHAMRMVIKDDSGAKTEERFVKIAPGQRLVVKW